MVYFLLLVLQNVLQVLVQPNECFALQIFLYILVLDLKLIENLKKSPKLVREAKFEDKARNIVWFPSVINMGELGMIFPEGTAKKYVWKYAKIVPIPKEEAAKYDNYDRRLDVENAMEFGQYEFIKACEEMGITRNMKQNV